MFSPFIQYSIDSEDLTKSVQTVQPQHGWAGRPMPLTQGRGRKAALTSWRSSVV